MKRRYLYVLMFSVPIVLASALAALAVFGAAAGLTWIYVAGDNVWPANVDNLLAAVFGLVFITSSLALIYRAYASSNRSSSMTTNAGPNSPTTTSSGRRTSTGI